MIDHYKVLGVSPDAEAEVIEGARNGLIKKYHPDKYKGDPGFALRKTQEINAAYDILKDPAKRAAYDRQRSAEMGAASNGPTPQPPPHATPEQERHNARASSPLPPDEPPPRKPSRAMRVASAVGIVVALILVRAAWRSEDTSPPVAETVPPATERPGVQATLTPEQRRDAELAKPLEFSPKTFVVVVDEDIQKESGFIPLSDLECRKTAHFTQEDDPGVSNGYFARKVSTPLPDGTRYVPYLTSSEDLKSAVWFGGIGKGVFLADVLDGQFKGSCGLMDIAQLDYQKFLQKNPDYPTTKKEADAIMARISYGGSFDGFRQQLTANFAARARELGADPSAFRDEINTIMEIVSLCATIDQSQVDAAVDQRTGSVDLARLGEGYARCHQDTSIISPLDKRPGIVIDSDFFLPREGEKQHFYLDAWLAPRHPVSKSRFDHVSDTLLVRWGFIVANFVHPAAPAHG